MSTGEEWWAQVAQALAKGEFAKAQVLVLEGLQKDPLIAFSAGHHVGAAHVLILAAHWSLIDSLLPPGSNFFSSSGWLESVRSNRPVNAAEQPLPWLTYPAIDFLESRLRPEWSVFEWGCGASTLWWSSRVSRVRSTESNEAWCRKISKELPGNCKVDLATTQKSYVGAIAEGGPYDVIVIDGDWRNECAEVAASQPSRLIIFDNTDVETFDAGVDALRAGGWQRLDFFGLIPSYTYKNCTSCFFKDPSVLAATRRPSSFTLSSGQSYGHATKKLRESVSGRS